MKIGSTKSYAKYAPYELPLKKRGQGCLNNSDCKNDGTNSPTTPNIYFNDPGFEKSDQMVANGQNTHPGTPTRQIMNPPTTPPKLPKRGGVAASATPRPNNNLLLQVVLFTVTYDDENGTAGS